MKLPSRNRNWLKEVQIAYAKAEKDVERSEFDLQKIFVFAPKYVAKNRGIKDKHLISGMVAHAVEDVQWGKEIDAGSEEHFRFHFVSAYVYSHAFAGLVDELECDRIMDYINQEWDLFPNENPPV